MIGLVIAATSDSAVNAAVAAAAARERIWCNVVDDAARSSFQVPAVIDRSPLERWTAGRVTLLGDAAHPMLPFFAQGSAQAFEDAVVLAGCLAGSDAATAPQALQRYERIRRPRASEVQLMSRGREVRNHLPDGPAQQERDAQLASGDPLRQSAWLYGHDLQADLQAHPA